MKIEIWSDIACPFCFIGKRHLEKAIEQIDFKEEITIIWKSYILDPTLPDIPVNTIYESLANKKGLSIDQVKQMTAHVESMASEAGLQPNFNTTLPVNTLNAHRLLQLAKLSGLGMQAKEKLFTAYFIDGKNIADKLVLKELGLGLGLDMKDLEGLWQNESISDLVNTDLYQAQTLGISGVPFFLIDGKYAVSGAQPTEVFINALNSIQQKTKLETEQLNNASCDIDSECD